MLFIPLNDTEIPEVYTSMKLAKGMIYNVDSDEYIGFQFNPTAFEWERTTKWSEQGFVGSIRGGDIQFVNVGPRKITLDLMYISDPRAPEVKNNSSYQIMDENKLVNFKAIVSTIEGWEELIDGLGRPSRIGIMVGGDYVFEGVIVSSGFRITEFWEDLSAKEAILSLEFREWLPLV